MRSRSKAERALRYLGPDTCHWSGTKPAGVTKLTPTAERLQITLWMIDHQASTGRNRQNRYATARLDTTVLLD